MNHTTTNSGVPVIAILATNGLMAVGMRSILERMIPYAVFKICYSFDDISHFAPEELFHIFVSSNELIEHSDFFFERRQKTIVMTSGTPHAQLLQGYNQINIEASQAQIEASLRMLHGKAHGVPSHASDESKSEILSPREIEVLKLIVEGLLNKQIAERLNIGLTTVISHRKNIFEKLGVKSVAGLTIYAVMKRYITI